MEWGIQGREAVVPAPPGRWRPGQGWCRCRRGPWYRRAARTGSRRGPPRSSADTKPWFLPGSARGTRCRRPCPTRGTQRKVSLGWGRGGQILPATRLPVWASRGPVLTLAPSGTLSRDGGSSCPLGQLRGRVRNPCSAWKQSLGPGHIRTYCVNK